MRRQTLGEILWLPSRSPERFFVRAARVYCVRGTGLFRALSDAFRRKLSGTAVDFVIVSMKVDDGVFLFSRLTRQKERKNGKKG